MKKYDPLWEIVDEKVRLQGAVEMRTTECPRCGVTIELTGAQQPGTKFRCGLCGAVCETVEGASIPDDRAAKIASRLAE